MSVAGYPNVLRKELVIADELSILCGVSVGYADPDFPANRLQVGRQPIGENIVFLGDEKH